MTADPTITAKIDRAERNNRRYGRIGMLLIALGFPAYAAGIWAEDGRWGWTGLLVQILGLIIWATFIANATVIDKRRQEFAKSAEGAR